MPSNVALTPNSSDSRAESATSLRAGVPWSVCTPVQASPPSLSASTRMTDLPSSAARSAGVSAAASTENDDVAWGTGLTCSGLSHSSTESHGEHQSRVKSRRVRRRFEQCTGAALGGVAVGGLVEGRSSDADRTQGWSAGMNSDKKMPAESMLPRRSPMFAMSALQNPAMDADLPVAASAT